MQNSSNWYDRLLQAAWVKAHRENLRNQFERQEAIRRLNAELDAALKAC
jgi:hypothetical protein